MSKLKSFLGMAYATPPVRTAVQAGLAVVIASGLGWVDVAVWKSAALAAGAALFSSLQGRARA